MAITAFAVWEIRPTGTTTGGGGFDSSLAGAGTDYSQQDSPQLTVSDGITNSTTLLTSVTGGFTSAMIGNAIYESGDPGNRYFITAVPTANHLTLDRSTGTGSGLTVNIGGALGINDVTVCTSFGTSYAVNGNVVFVKSGIGSQYLIPASLSVQGVDGTSGRAFWLKGYDTIGNRNISSRPTSKPRFRSSTNNHLIGVPNAVRGVISDFILDTNNAGGSWTATNNPTVITIQRCDGVNGGGASNNYSSGPSGAAVLIECTGIGSPGVDTIFYQGIAWHSKATSIQANQHGFKGQGNFMNCEAMGISPLNGSVAFITYGGPTIGCMAYNCAQGFNADDGGSVPVFNCFAHTCGTGFHGVTGSSGLTMLYGCGCYNCATDVSATWNPGIILNGLGVSAPIIHCTADPCVSASTGNFTLNNVAGGGALVRGSGYQVVAGDATTGYIDIGPKQHQDSGGSSSSTVSGGSNFTNGFMELP